MMKVFAAVLLLTLSDCHSKVVNDFTDEKAACPQFFANPNDIRSPPTIFPENHYKQICQIRDSSLRVEFATLYDTKNKIPVYSAYKFKGRRNSCVRPNTPWFIEPQLDDQNKGPKMDSESSVKPISKQAVNTDYEGEGTRYHKGHLVPVYHARKQSCADATFTLTNAAPQDRSFNCGQWRVAERKVAEFLELACAGYKVYIVTGVTPSETKFIKNGVNVPSHFWSGFCCLDQNTRPTLSGGFYGENKNDPVTYATLKELEYKLKGLYARSFLLFKDQCNKIGMEMAFKECMNYSKNLNLCARKIRDT